MNGAGAGMLSGSVELAALAALVAAAVVSGRSNAGAETAAGNGNSEVKKTRARATRRYVCKEWSNEARRARA
jgi:hypothetical protein